jgi:branched-chain amino acid transport system substrate-binding protein
MRGLVALSGKITVGIAGHLDALFAGQFRVGGVMKIDRRVLSLSLFLALTACAPPEPIRIGFIGGLTGRVADLGQAGRNGFQLAVEQMNAAGGVQGRSIEIIVRDDDQDPAQARRAAEELVAAKVALIIGPMTSAMVEPVLAVATAGGITVLSPTVTSPDLTGKDDLFLRIMADTRVYAELSARYNYDKNGVRRVAAVFDQHNRAYSENWLAAFRQSFSALGGTMVAEIAFESAEGTDHGALVRQMLAAQPDALLFVSGALDTARFAQQARQIGAQQKLFSVEWSATERLIELGGKAVDGMYMAQQFDRNDRSPTYLSFANAYEARFHSPPGFPSVAAYDATRAALETLARGGSSSKLKQSLIEGSPFKGVQQAVLFDRFGDSQRPAFNTLIHDGQFVLVKQGE